MRVLIVCHGNTCRSPMAEGVLRQALGIEGLDGRVEVASAGVHARHPGGPADPRAVSAAGQRGIDISAHTVRQLIAADLAAHDLIVPVDRATERAVIALAPLDSPTTVRLLMSFVPGGAVVDVPDPYDVGTAQAYSQALDMIATGCRGLAGWLAVEINARGARPTC